MCRILMSWRAGCAAMRCEIKQGKKEEKDVVIQRILFPQIGKCTEQELYFRKAACTGMQTGKPGECGGAAQGISYHYSEGSLRLEKGKPVGFNTYFNGCSIDKWKKYTILNNLSLRLALKGKVKVTLVTEYLLHENRIERILGESIADTADRQEFTVSCDIKNARGMLSFRLEALEDGGIFYGGAYCSQAEQQTLRDVKIGVGICTFRRERYVEKNLRILQKEIMENKDSPLCGRLEILIADNGKTLDPGRMGMKHVHIYPNPNLGGTGGFTRCMIEMKRNREKLGITHVLLMDDDVVIEPQALERTYMLLTLVREEYRDTFIGGAMLRLDQQCIQHESGAVWHLDTGMVSPLKDGLDLREVRNCIYNEIEEYTSYIAWWYCCFPLCVAEDDNLPFPFFIKIDDVEYSIRNMKHLILMNGICVWHDPFEYKYASYLEYYVVRNRMIMSALQGDAYRLHTVLRQMLAFCLREITYYRYKNVELYLRGVRDFLKGPAWLMRQDGEALNQDLIRCGYQAQELEELDMGFDQRVYEASRQDYGQGSSRKKRIFTINGLLLPAKGDNIAPMASVRGVHCYRRRRVMNYEVMSNKAFITQRSFIQTVLAVIKVMQTAAITCKGYRKAKEAYQKDGRRLMTLKYWKRQLKIH